MEVDYLAVLAQGVIGSHAVTGLGKGSRHADCTAPADSPAAAPKPIIEHGGQPATSGERAGGRAFLTIGITVRRKAPLLIYRCLLARGAALR
jgi:hypothetical protein